MGMFLGWLMAFLSLFLVMLILVQRGKGGGLTGALGGPGGQSAFGSKAGDTFTVITVATASIWGFTCAFAMWWWHVDAPTDVPVAKSNLSAGPNDGDADTSTGNLTEGGLGGLGVDPLSESDSSDTDSTEGETTGTPSADLAPRDNSGEGQPETSDTDAADSDTPDSDTADTEAADADTADPEGTEEETATEESTEGEPAADSEESTDATAEGDTDAPAEGDTAGNDATEEGEQSE